MKFHWLFPIFIPHFNGLSIFYKRSKTLSQPINIFIYINRQCLCCIGFFCLIIYNISHISKSCICKFPFSIHETDSPGIWFLINYSFRFSCLVNKEFFCFLYRHFRQCFFHLSKKAAFISRSLKVFHRHLDHIFHRARRDE